MLVKYDVLYRKWEPSVRLNLYIIVVIDYFSKWPEVYAIPNQTAKTVALIEYWISRFESVLFQEMCQALGIRTTRTTPLHPQSDGMVERFNRTIEGHLSKVVSSNQKDWDTHIPFVQSFTLNKIIFNQLFICIHPTHNFNTIV